MRKISALLLVSVLFLSLHLAISPATSGATSVKVDPSLIEYYQDATGEQFTVAIKIVDATNLYGFDLKFRWNTTFLDYVSRSVRVPKDTNPDGVLWNPIIQVMDDVNPSAGTYWIAFSSRWPAPSFNGSGTVFTITFMVKYHPVQPEPTANMTLELFSTELSNNAAQPIPHTKQNGRVILHALSLPHDIAVTGVTPLKTIVGQGYSCNINVTVINQGGSSETFNVTAYANTSVIATLENIILLSGDSKTITFVWNTAGFARGNYTISVFAIPVPGETDTGDNTYPDGIIRVLFPGDVNGDKKVDGKDIALVAKYFGKLVGYPPNADINNDGKIEGKDIAITAKNFGTIYT